MRKSEKVTLKVKRPHLNNRKRKRYFSKKKSKDSIKKKKILYEPFRRLKDNIAPKSYSEKKQKPTK